MKFFIAYLGSSVKGKMLCFWIEVEPALSKIPGFEPELKKKRNYLLVKCEGRKFFSVYVAVVTIIK